MILTVTLNPCIDKTYFVDENRPGKFINVTEIKIIGGGKGINVARVLKIFGYDVLALALIGGYEGKIVENMINNEGIKNIPVWIKDRTREIITILEIKNNRQTAYFEPSPFVDTYEKNKLMKTYKKLAEKSDLIILSGSVPHKDLDDAYFHMIEYAKHLGIKTILDSRDAALKLGIEASPYLVKPNIKEAEFIINKKISSKEDMLKALDYLQPKKIEIIVLSLGGEGALIKVKDKKFLAKPPKVKLVNPVGSGDSMVAGLAIGIIENMETTAMLKLGVAAGAANASIWDAAFITKEQVYNILKNTKIITIK